MKTTNELLYTKMLSDEDIVVHARIIAEASHEIREIEESKRKLRDLKATIERHSKYIQEGKIELQTTAEFEWHTPIADQVTVHSINGDFRDFVRLMTEEELKEHCQLELPFEEKEDSEEIPTTAGESTPLNPDHYYIEGSHATWFVRRKGQIPCVAFFNDEDSCKLFLKHYLITSSLNQAFDLMREDKAAERRAQLETIRNEKEEL